MAVVRLMVAANMKMNTAFTKINLREKSSIMLKIRAYTRRDLCSLSKSSSAVRCLKTFILDENFKQNFSSIHSLFLNRKMNPKLYFTTLQSGNIYGHRSHC